MSDIEKYLPFLDNLDKLKDLTRKKVLLLNDMILAIKFEQHIKEASKDRQVDTVYCLKYDGKDKLFQEYLFFTNRDRKLVETFAYNEGGWDLRKKYKNFKLTGRKVKE